MVQSEATAGIRTRRATHERVHKPVRIQSFGLFLPQDMEASRMKPVMRLYQSVHFTGGEKFQHAVLRIL
jgi:hypothetical protein